MQIKGKLEGEKKSQNKIKEQKVLNMVIAGPKQ
jgi:hypothetical protein